MSCKVSVINSVLASKQIEINFHRTEKNYFDLFF